MSLKTSLCNERVDKLHLTDPVKVSETTSLREVIATMQKARRGAVLVCTEDNTLRGLFTERDLVDRILGDDVNLDDPIDTFLVDEPRIVQPDDHVGEALEMMATHGLRHVAVCDQNRKVLGIVSVRNIIDCLAEQYPMEVINQPPRADQSLSAQEGG